MKVVKKVLIDFNFDEEEEKAIRKVDELLNEMCKSEYSSCDKCVFNNFCNDGTRSIKGILKGMVGYDAWEIE